VKQKAVSPKDANIAKEGLELLVTCLQLRSPLLATFYNQPCVGDFIIDILVGSAQDEIRDVALDQFYLLSQTELSPPENSGHQVSAHHFMLQTLLKARLPFWVTSSNTRSAGVRLLKQCSQYFDLRCRLVGYLSADDQERLGVNVSSMLEDELAWLSNFVPSENADNRDIDNILLAGHLKLIKTLLTCAGVDKRDFGRSNPDSSQSEWSLEFNNSTGAS
jgi:ubiquitin carboxyl-terminal hydrolase 9/24